MKHLLFVIITLCVVMPLSTAGPASAQQDQRQEWPKLDSTLMATKELRRVVFLVRGPRVPMPHRQLLFDLCARRLTARRRLYTPRRCHANRRSVCAPPIAYAESTIPVGTPTLSGGRHRLGTPALMTATHSDS